MIITQHFEDLWKHKLAILGLSIDLYLKFRRYLTVPLNFGRSYNADLKFITIKSKSYVSQVIDELEWEIAKHANVRILIQS